MGEENMDNEQEETKGEAEAKPTEDIAGGDKPQTSILVDDTNLASKRLEEANKETLRLEQLKESNYAKMKLGGVTKAGQGPKKTEEESDAEYTEKFLKGEVNPLE